MTFIILAGISAGIYFIFLCYMVWKVFCNISVKRSSLPSMSVARRLHYEGIIYRFKFLMFTTLVCAAMTVILFILGQVLFSGVWIIHKNVWFYLVSWKFQIAEGQWKWDDHMEWQLSSAFYTGVYGMWNIYIAALLILYAPSHKQWPSESGNGNIFLFFIFLCTVCLLSARNIGFSQAKFSIACPIFMSFRERHS